MLKSETKNKMKEPKKEAKEKAWQKEKAKRKQTAERTGNNAAKGKMEKVDYSVLEIQLSFKMLDKQLFRKLKVSLVLCSSADAATAGPVTH